jgi:altronate dehydratase large subunit
MFQGYRRANGRVGTRNLVAIIPTVGCANHASGLIARQVEGAALVGYNGGCSETYADIDLATQLLAQYGAHPNVASSIVVSLGCETLNANKLVERIRSLGGTVELLVIQQEGGTRKTVEKGVALAREMVAKARQLQREPCPMSALTVGLECGGSDATSGLAANPTEGAFSDLLVAQGGTVILAETSELLGAEHIMQERASSPVVAQAILRTVDDCERALKATGEDFVGKQPSPGNIVGGITTVEEKALGDVLKGGTTPITEVLTYGQVPSQRGLVFMDTPGNDLASVTALVAAGSQIVLFTTGRGNPMGNAIAPVIKITGNRQTYEHMHEDMDLDASTIISGEETVAQVGQRLFEMVQRVASGEQTASEALGHSEFSMLRYGPVY